MELTIRKNGLTARTDTLGGELVSFQGRRGTEHIWGGDPAYWSGRNPVLFPIVGGLKDGRVSIGGKPFEMARHGFARRSEFAVFAQGEDFVEFELRESAETLRQYPFPFSLRVRHQLLDNGFSTRFTVTNTGTAPMPFCIGAHTAFRCPLEAGERFEDYRLVFDRTEDTVSILPGAGGCLQSGAAGIPLDHTNTIELDHAVFDRVDTLIYQGLSSKTVSLRHKDTSRGVRVDFSQFPMVAFWTVPGKNAPYICIEPWQGCAAFDNESGNFGDKPWCVTLTPGEEKALAYTVTLVSE